MAIGLGGITRRLCSARLARLTPHAVLDPADPPQALARSLPRSPRARARRISRTCSSDSLADGCCSPLTRPPFRKLSAALLW